MPSNRPLLRELLQKDASFLREVAAGQVVPRAAPYELSEALVKAADALGVGVAARTGGPRTAPGGTAVVPFGSLQHVLRPAFEKPGVKAATFGDHPDYLHLRGTVGTEFGAITTLFLDVANSTRLGLLYPLERVYHLKNAVLCAAIEIVNAFDGHVHRLMGDAVMAFFGGRGRRPEDGAIDALNCAAALRYYHEVVVAPGLAAVGGAPDDGLGIRLGLDHGPADRVLWSAYGYPGNEEVTATSFHVDVAAKLQHAAGRNQVMIGQSLRGLLDFPDGLVRDKTVTVDGAPRPVPFVTPNHTLVDGRPHNYRQHLLDWEAYLATTGVAAADPARFAPDVRAPDACEVFVTTHELAKAPPTGAYGPSSRMVAKGTVLRFAVRNRVPWLAGSKVTFAVENHGAEAARAPGGRNGDHETTATLSGTGDDAAVRWEPTAYRGLHYMTVTVAHPSAGGPPAFRQRIGVYVD